SRLPVLPDCLFRRNALPPARGAIRRVNGRPGGRPSEGHLFRGRPEVTLRDAISFAVDREVDPPTSFNLGGAGSRLPVLPSSSSLSVRPTLERGWQRQPALEIEFADAMEVEHRLDVDPLVGGVEAP